MVSVNEGVHCEGLRALEVDNVGLQMVCKFCTHVMTLPSRGIIIQVTIHHTTLFSSRMVLRKVRFASFSLITCIREQRRDRISVEYLFT